MRFRRALLRSAQLQAFSSAIAWSTDTWIFYLLFFHFSLLMFAFVTRKHLPSQALTMVCVSVMIGLSEQMNKVAKSHFTEFSSQNYFDDRGVFAGVFWGFPLLVVAGFIAINLVVRAGELLVVVKRNELKGKGKGKGAV